MKKMFFPGNLLLPDRTVSSFDGRVCKPEEERERNGVSDDLSE